MTCDCEDLLSYQHLGGSGSKGWISHSNHCGCRWGGGVLHPSSMRVCACVCVLLARWFKVKQLAR